MCVFFCQAEDGIRDLVRSRGLGDVYKRQVQFNYGYTVDQCRRAVEMIDADALILHLNPLQEAVQPEGDGNWRGLLGKIADVCARLEKPVIVKEVGWGISAQTARRLIEAGVSAIAVSYTHLTLPTSDLV